MSSAVCPARRQMHDVQHAQHSIPSAVTMGLWRAFVRQREWFALDLGVLCQRVTWQNDELGLGTI